MDNRDEIIRQQLDVIGTLLNNSMRRVSDDFWGTPVTGTSRTPETNAPQSETKTPAQPGKPAGTKTEARAEAAAPEAEAVPEKENIEDLKKELDELIGLDNIKKEVRNLINMVTIHNLRKANNLKTVDMSLHMVFSGNPGTGKTMIARLMARIYHSLDVLSKGQLVEVDRSGLVAGYIGQTATKTQEVIKKAMGGVLFIDEAYTLSSSKGENDFGQEAIDTLLKAMEDNREDLIVIVAGYDGLMDQFIHSNPGLESRFNRYLHFDDYTIDEMMSILELQLKKGQYTMDDAAKAAARDYIEVSNTSSIAFGNARGVRNIFERLLVVQSNRLAEAENVTADDLMAITADDVKAARESDDKLKKALDEKAKSQEEAMQALKELEQLAKDVKAQSAQTETPAEETKA